MREMYIMIGVIGIGTNKTNIYQDDYGYDNYIYLDDDYNDNHKNNFNKELDNLNIYQKFQYILNTSNLDDNKHKSINLEHKNNYNLSNPIPIPKQNYF